MDDELLKKYAYVKRSSYRYRVVKSLHGSFKTPTMISKDTGIVLNHISNVLADLKDSGFVECINEEVRKGRLYRLTDDGIDVAEYISLKG